MSTSSLTPEEIKQITQAKKEYNEAFMNGSPTMQDEAREYFDTVLDIILKKLGGGLPIPGPLPGCGPNPDPNNEHVKEGGWGGDMAAAKLWDAVPMTDNPALFKVVDAAGKNIAHKFTSEAEAQKFIDYHRCKQEQGGPDPDPNPVCPPGQHRDAAGVCVPDTPGPTPTPGTTPYPIKGTLMNSSQRGPTERHYASGKADDWTIEKNVKNIPFSQYQWVNYVTMGPIEHDDTISVKFGGVHMGAGGWWDCGISFGGQTCLGTEPKHPSTNLCIVKGPKLGSVLNKKVGVAGVVFKATGKIELWIDMGDGWKKACEGTNVGGLKPTSGNQEAQLRIDGFNYSGKKDESDMEKIVAAGGPRIHSAIVTEI